MSYQLTFGRAETFIYNNARLLDRRRFEFLFKKGDKHGVIAALRAYQNDDGGFGNALEPDIRCPQSQPVSTEMALMIMDELGYFDPDTLDGIIRYLRRVTLTGGGVPTSFLSGREYPHARWWFTGADTRPSINPTGRIVGLLYKQQVRDDFYDEPWFVNTVDYLWESFANTKPQGYHDGIQWIAFLQNTPHKNRASAIFSKIESWMKTERPIETDPDADGYVQKVLDWAPTSSSYARGFVSQSDIKTHLNALLKDQQEDGGWPITWIPISPGVELEWRGSITVDRLKTIASYSALGT